jgi:hypothetical protein
LVYKEVGEYNSGVHLDILTVDANVEHGLFLGFGARLADNRDVSLPRRPLTDRLAGSELKGGRVERAGYAHLVLDVFNGGVDEGCACTKRPFR